MEERLAGGGGRSELARCWEEIGLGGGRFSEWEKERQNFFGERGREMGEMEREGLLDFSKLEERDRNGQREERWERIGRDEV